MDRLDVYAVIDGERNYQDCLASTSETDGHHTVTEFLLYMDAYMHDAKQVASKTWGPQATIKTLDLIRKITALGVACMEQNGAVRRVCKLRIIKDMKGSLRVGREMELGKDVAIYDAVKLIADGYLEVVR